MFEDYGDNDDYEKVPPGTLGTKEWQQKRNRDIQGAEQKRKEQIKEAAEQGIRLTEFDLIDPNA